MSYTPAEKAILDEIESRLGNITTANGYNNEFIKITRARLTPFKGFDLPAANYYMTGTDVTKDNYGDDNHTMLLVVEAHSRTHDLDFIDVAMSLCADVVTGLFRATTDPAVTDIESTSLGGTVQSFKYIGHSPFIGEGQDPFCGTLIRFEIDFKTNLGDMINYN